MRITEVRVKLLDDPSERLQAFCSLTIDDCFVIRDVKIISGANGPFVAMPSRKLTAHCPRCGCKNHLRAAYCNQCGTRLHLDRLPADDDGRTKLYADIAHPINSACRELIQQEVIRVFQEETERSKQPGYVPRYDDFGEEELAAGEAPADEVRSRPTRPVRPPVGTPPNERTDPPQNVGASPVNPPHAVPGETLRGAPPAARPERGAFGAGIF